jgi:hypothetical protein
MPSTKLKNYILNIFKILYIKSHAHPPHEHIKPIQYLYDKCMPPVRRQKYAATVQGSVKCIFTMSVRIDKYRKNP